ncbi:MAG: DUF4157 domain-containing protein [Polyangiales bacterium]
MHALVQPPANHTPVAPTRPPAPAAPRGVPRPLRTQMESHFDADFSQVRLHPESARAVALGADAFTEGSDIYLAPGHFRPEAQEGRALLGHELTHVVQQREGRVVPTSSHAGVPVNDAAALEQEADRRGALAARAVSSPGLAAPRTAHAAHGTAVVQRKPATRGGTSPFGSDMHGALLDAFARDTGRPRDSVSAYEPDYGYWLTFSRLDRQSVADLMASVFTLDAEGRLDDLIANRLHALPFHHERLETAMLVVRQLRGPTRNDAAARALIARSSLPQAEREAMGRFVAPGRDQRAAIGASPEAALPDQPLAREIGFELDPASRPPPTPPTPPPPPAPGGAAPAPAPPTVTPPRTPWAGRTGAPGAAAVRTSMRQRLFSAFDAYLTAFRPTTVARLAQPRIPLTAPSGSTGIVDIANQARGELERRYAVSLDAAVSSPRQVSDRAVRRATSPDQNIFDASSEADRLAMTGSTELASGVAWWLFENDVPGAAGAAGSRPFASEILASEHYSTQDPGAEDFRWEVARAYAAANTLTPVNRRQLIDYRMTDWSERATRGITVNATFDAGTNRNRAELEQRWQSFGTATHELLHLRTHPAFVAAAQGRATMGEGFTEMFTIATLNNDVLPRLRAGSAEPLRRAVEGALSPATPDATLLSNRTTPTQYVEHRAQAERIRDGGTPPAGIAHTGIGEAAVRAAYFQGHVEYLGLDAAGAQLASLPSAPGARRSVRIPAGVTDLSDLARRSGVPAATVQQDNPGIGSPLPATAVLAGCREHWVVAGETRAHVAAQNGVSEVALVRANPDLTVDASGNWPTLSAGHRLLIPAR